MTAERPVAEFRSKPDLATFCDRLQRLSGHRCGDGSPACRGRRETGASSHCSSAINKAGFEGSVSGRMCMVTLRSTVRWHLE